MSNRLIVLPPSHFCERARWALDAMRIPYVEERWAVGPHMELARQIAPKTSLPILATADRTIQGSGAILDWTGMAGGEAGTETRLEEGLATMVRRLIYSATLHETAGGIDELLFDGVDDAQTVLARSMWPMTRRAMAERMQASPDRVPEIAAAIDGELDWFEARLAGRDHLVGETFGRADLTAGSLMSPILRRRPGGESSLTLPPDVLALIAGWNRRPALLWARDIYARHRR